MRQTVEVLCRGCGATLLCAVSDDYVDVLTDCGCDDTEHERVVTRAAEVAAAARDPRNHG